MGKSVRIGEKYLLDLIESVILENKTFLKVGSGSQQAPPPVPPMDMSMMQPTEMGADPMGGMGQDPSLGQGGMQQDQNGGEEESQFDTNFDAGVEADEDSDPKTYIQQLTGKLSQSLNSFNNDQGVDAGLNKYVASMIVTATCKNLDDKAKDDIIKKIKSANSGTDEDMPDNGELDNSDMGDGTEMQESVFSKKQIFEMAKGIGIRPDVDDDNVAVKETEPVDSIFKGKKF